MEPSKNSYETEDTQVLSEQSDDNEVCARSPSGNVEESNTVLDGSALEANPRSVSGTLSAYEAMRFKEAFFESKIIEMIEARRQPRAYSSWSATRYYRHHPR